MDPKMLELHALEEWQFAREQQRLSPHARRLGFHEYKQLLRLVAACAKTWEKKRRRIRTGLEGADVAGLVNSIGRER